MKGQKGHRLKETGGTRADVTEGTQTVGNTRD